MSQVMKRVFIILVSLIGWVFAQSNYNLGLKAQKGGLHKEASEYFIAHLREKPDHIKSKVALKESGQKHLNSLIGKFHHQSSSGSDKEAVDAFLSCEQYYRLVDRAGVELEFDNQARVEYKQHLDNFSELRYSEGLEKYSNREYGPAQIIFAEIYALNSSYKDVSTLLIESQVIPLYQSAMEDYNNGQYKSAYKSFKRITQLKYGYKDVSIVMEDALIKSRINLAFFPFNSSQVSSGVVEEVNAHILSDIIHKKDELLQVLDKSKVDRVISEQNFVIRNSEDVVKIGGLLGAKVLLTGKVIEYSFEGGHARETPKSGYIIRNESTGVDANGKATWTQKRYNITYYEVMGASRGTIKIEYQLVSTENGQVLFSDIVTKEVTDDVHYFKSDQELQYVNSETENMSKYRNLNNNKKNLAGEREIRNALIDKACDDVSGRVVSRCSGL